MDLHALIKLTNFEHSRKVSEISALLAKWMGYSPSETEIIRQAALFHDVGKSGIAPEILNRPGKLTEREYEIVKTHVQLGSRQIAEAILFLTAAYRVAQAHHERCNGTGYPYGLTENEIHPYARLVSVADVLDALASNRPYRKALSVNEALEYLKNQSGVLFDKDVVAVLLDRWDDVAALYR